MRVWAVVAAAGKGARAGLGQNKVFQRVAGVSVLTRTLRALEAGACFDGAVLVLAPGEREIYETIAESEGRCPLVCVLAEGGASRAESVARGLRLVPEDVDLVAVHDAARPFVTPELIRAAVDSAARFGSGVVCTGVVDTVKRVDEQGLAVETPDRASLRAVQTPQVFRRAELLRAYEQALAAGENATDDASLWERRVGPVRLVTAPGAERNRKLTTREDFMEAERMLGGPRVGYGLDAHRLVEGRALVLCGVEIPWEKGLLGHSDADVAVHALMDALLGAAALGDIGRLFPDSDPAYEGISSMLLLEQVRRLLEEKGLRAANVDITIAAQRPKLAPYRDRMRDNIAAARGLGADRVNVKATTTEGMGYEGRGEGISAHAVAMVVPM